jgi:hypothetical protein
MGFRVWSLLASIPNKPKRIGQEKAAASSGGLFILREAAGAMSAIGTKRTFQSHALMSAFGGKADMAQKYLSIR